METLAYSHLATAEENSTVELSFEGVNWKRFSSLGVMGLLSAATILGALSTTADSAAACHHTCGSKYGHRSYRKSYRPRYRHASYHGRRHGYYLSYGSRGHKVAKLQHQLGVMGYFHHHRATGYFGPKTKHAVKAFQYDVGLRPDGVVGPRTMAALGF
ncbi:peptidoglycan-binding domain-containing protein [Okeania sp.]|uniref:peptidoglycan-binding domain-containing protein n=1 Tax=Okeania sp. TaxID=3100323 RepID=UPI002B4B2391|nr:peptidoglycan-binding domain-containing protein [Okeania sp.]MEB3339531.1 peptidoglycan-binding domain-containing protein [Okeania sp.]